MLAKKDAGEQEALQELTSQAKVEIQEWYARHEEQLSQTKGTNRWVWFVRSVRIMVCTMNHFPGSWL